MRERNRGGIGSYINTWSILTLFTTTCVICSFTVLWADKRSVSILFRWLPSARPAATAQGTDPPTAFQQTATSSVQDAELADRRSDISFATVPPMPASVSAWMKGFADQYRGDVRVCRRDPTLPPPASLQRRFFLVANFYNSEKVLPTFIMETLTLVSRLPRGTVYVSIFESNSGDRSPQMLEQYQKQLSQMGVPHRVVWKGPGGRDLGRDRIALLARFRNAALAPLIRRTAVQLRYRAGASNVSTDYAGVLGHSVGSRRRRRSRRRLATAAAAPAVAEAAAAAVAGGIEGGGTSGHSKYFSHADVARAPSGPIEPTINGAPLDFDPDQILFINDVFFCADDLVRLAAYQVDIACGLDLNPSAGAHLYDFWVVSDVKGEKSTAPPYTNDPVTAEWNRQGLPSPVSCCWNGMVALNAAPFVRSGLRMRTHRKGECRASECSLLCHDFRRLGYNRIYMDTSVRTTYDMKAINFMEDKQIGLRSSSWADVQQHLQRHPVPPRGARIQHYDNETCCDLDPGKQYVDFNNACHRYNIFSNNYTAGAIAPYTDAMCRKVPEGFMFYADMDHNGDDLECKRDANWTLAGQASLCLADAKCRGFNLDVPGSCLKLRDEPLYPSSEFGNEDPCHGFYIKTAGLN